MSYERSNASALDYEPCCYGASRLIFRGPQRDLNGPYVAVLGGTEVFGRCVPEPFPDLLETRTGEACVNLGQQNAGLDAFLADPEVPGILTEAKASVVQVLGAPNLSNRHYRVHPRRNDRFLAASDTLKSIFDEVDFTEFTFNRHMLQTLQSVCPDRFEIVRDELQTAWVFRMKSLIQGVKVAPVLLWLRIRTEDVLGDDPLMVTRAMIDEVCGDAREVVEIHADPCERAQDLDGMVIGPTEWPATARLIGPRTHTRIADALCDVLS